MALKTVRRILNCAQASGNITIKQENRIYSRLLQGGQKLKQDDQILPIGWVDHLDLGWGNSFWIMG